MWCVLDGEFADEAGLGTATVVEVFDPGGHSRASLSIFLCLRVLEVGCDSVD